MLAEEATFSVFVLSLVTSSKRVAATTGIFAADRGVRSLGDTTGDSEASTEVVLTEDFDTSDVEEGLASSATLSLSEAALTPAIAAPDDRSGFTTFLIYTTLELY